MKIVNTVALKNQDTETYNYTTYLLKMINELAALALFIFELNCC